MATVAAAVVREVAVTVTMEAGLLALVSAVVLPFPVEVRLLQVAAQGQALREREVAPVGPMRSRPRARVGNLTKLLRRRRRRFHLVPHPPLRQ